MKGALDREAGRMSALVLLQQEIIPEAARQIVVASERLHPHWYASVDEVPSGAQAASNPGYDHCTPETTASSNMPTLVIAFPNEDGGGGTGQGIRIAEALNIPVMQFNKGAEAVLMNQTLLTAINHLGLIPGAGLVRVTESENVDVYV